MLNQLDWWVEVRMGGCHRFFKNGSGDIKLEASVVDSQFQRKFAGYDLGEEWS
jgi:hypothetical protein